MSARNKAPSRLDTQVINLRVAVASDDRTPPALTHTSRFIELAERTAPKAAR